MLTEYLNQTITRKTITSINDANEKTYATGTIQARFSYKRKLIRTSNDEQIMSDAMVHSKVLITEGDVITFDSKDWKVRFVYNWIGLDGSVIGYKAVL
jgi:hypothetical protein